MNVNRLASRFATAVIVVLGSLAGHQAWPAAEGMTFSQADEKAIVGAALEVKKAILTENVEGFLRLVSHTEGLTCTDTWYSSGQIEDFLANKRSDLYLSLFRTKDFTKKCNKEYPTEYPALSDKDFLQTSNESFSVTWLEANWAQVTITSPIKTHYPREWYFHREGSIWRLGGDGFIIGDCTCG